MPSPRIVAIRQVLAARRLDGFLVTHAPHVRYLSGFSGSNGWCLITRSSTILLTDSRYALQVREEVRGFRALVVTGQFGPAMARHRLLRGGNRLGYQPDHLSVDELQGLRRHLPHVRLVPAKSVVEPLAAAKEPAELRLIEHAIAITERVFAKLLNLLSPGLRELDVAAEILYWHRRFGADAEGFEPIVASGARGALPHARASAKKLKKGEMVTLDFGCVYRGYYSDLTRTVSLGRPTREMKNVYGVVLDAQRRGIDHALNGIGGRALDAVVRRSIAKGGYGRFFRHSLGHGLGIEVHEPLRLSPLSKDTLAEGNVVTIEPGVYLPNVGGVRIEDDVYIGRTSNTVLTRAPKELLML